MLKNINTNALFERSYECGAGAGMKHIGFYLDGLGLTAIGSGAGMSSTQKASLNRTLENNGASQTGAAMVIGDDD